MLQQPNIEEVYIEKTKESEHKKMILRVLTNFCEIVKEPSNLKKIEKQIVENHIIEDEECSFYIDYKAIAMVLAIGKKYLDPPTDWDEVIYTYMQEIREVIQNSASFIGTGAISGLAAYGSSVNQIYKSTGYFNRFKDSLNLLVFQQTEEFALKVSEDYEGATMSSFDAIMGLSGTTRYLLEFKEDVESRKAIEASLKFLIELTKEKQVEGVSVPCYHITSENHFSEEEKEIYNNGSFNFSLSHGMAGPLTVLSLALLEGVEIEGQRDAIQKILNDICRFSSIETDGTVNWAARVSFEEYIGGIDEISQSRASWCYGGPGIGRSVYIASKAIGDENAMSLALQSMEGLCKMPIEDYLLESPIICHGYAGILAVLTAMYKDTGDFLYYKRIEELVEIILDYYDENSIFGFKNIFTYMHKDRSIQGHVVQEDRVCFLEGASGIILSLLSFLDDGNSEWMKNLLIL